MKVVPIWQQVGWSLVISTNIRALVISANLYRHSSTSLLTKTTNNLAQVTQLPIAKSLVQLFSRRLVAHLAVLTLVMAVVATGTTAGSQLTPATRLAAQRGYGGAADSTASAYIAANIAADLDLAVAEEAGKQVRELSGQATLATAADAFLTKPHVAATDTASRSDITSYTVKSGDTVGSLATKFGITSDTIRWANDLASWEEVAAGQKLTILPVSGVLHKVSAGDTPENLANKYDANAAQIVSFNDAELSGLKAGTKVVIPEGVKPYQPIRNYVPYAAFFGGNGYSYGYCTWHAANRRDEIGKPIPSSWGNAYDWRSRAPASRQGSTPKVGAIAWESMWYPGHVAFVESVNENGTVTVSEMNYQAPLGVVTTRTMPADYFWYIY